MPVPVPVLDWLRSGIPLTLLMDLAPAKGPDSQTIARTEGTEVRDLVPQNA